VLSVDRSAVCSFPVCVGDCSRAGIAVVFKSSLFVVAILQVYTEMHGHKILGRPVKVDDATNQ
jgi:hypothetical protein